MEHTEPDNLTDPAPGETPQAEERFARPDRRGPRGNQDVEQVDVERGEAKIERVLGW